MRKSGSGRRDRREGSALRAAGKSMTSTGGSEALPNGDGTKKRRKTRRRRPNPLAMSSRRRQPSPFASGTSGSRRKSGESGRSGPEMAATQPIPTSHPVKHSIRLPAASDLSPGLTAHPVVRAVQGLFELVAGYYADVWSVSLVRAGCIAPAGPHDGKAWGLALQRTIVGCKVRNDYRTRAERELLASLHPWITCAQKAAVAGIALTADEIQRHPRLGPLSAGSTLDERMLRLMMADVVLAEDGGHVEAEGKGSGEGVSGGNVWRLAAENAIFKAISDPNGLPMLAGVAPYNDATIAAQDADDRERDVDDMVAAEDEFVEEEEEGGEEEEEDVGDGSGYGMRDGEGKGGRKGGVPRLPMRPRRFLPPNEAEALSVSCALNSTIASEEPVTMEALKEHLEAAHRLIAPFLEARPDEMETMDKEEKRELRKRFRDAMREARKAEAVMIRVRVRRTREIEEEERGVGVSDAEGAALHAAEERIEERKVPVSDTPALDKHVREKSTGIAKDVMRDALRAAQEAAEEEAIRRAKEKRERREGGGGEGDDLGGKYYGRSKPASPTPKAAAAGGGGGGGGYWGARPPTTKSDGPTFIVSWEEGEPLEPLRTVRGKAHVVPFSPERPVAERASETRGSLSSIDSRDDRLPIGSPEAASSVETPMILSPASPTPVLLKSPSWADRLPTAADLRDRGTENLLPPQRPTETPAWTRESRIAAVVRIQAAWRGFLGRHWGRRVRAVKRADELAKLNAGRRLAKFIRTKRSQRLWRKEIGSDHDVTKALAARLRQAPGHIVRDDEVDATILEMDRAARVVQRSVRRQQARHKVLQQRKLATVRERSILRSFFQQHIAGRKSHRWRAILRRVALVHAQFCRGDQAIQALKDQATGILRNRVIEWERKTAKSVYDGKLPDRWFEQQVPCDAAEVLALARAAYSEDVESPERRRKRQEELRAKGRSVLPQDGREGESTASLPIPATTSAGTLGAASPLALAAAKIDGSHRPTHPLLSIGSPALLGELTEADVSALVFVAQSEAKATSIPPLARSRPRLVRQGTLWNKVTYLHEDSGIESAEHPLMARARARKAQRLRKLDEELEEVRIRVERFRTERRETHTIQLHAAIDADTEELARRAGVRRLRASQRRALAATAGEDGTILHDRVQPFRVKKLDSERATTSLGTKRAASTTTTTTKDDRRAVTASGGSREEESGFKDPLAASAYEDILSRTRQRMNQLLAEAMS